MNYIVLRSFNIEIVLSMFKQTTNDAKNIFLNRSYTWQKWTHYIYNIWLMMVTLWNSLSHTVKIHMTYNVGNLHSSQFSKRCPTKARVPKQIRTKSFPLANNNFSIYYATQNNTISFNFEELVWYLKFLHFLYHLVNI